MSKFAKLIANSAMGVSNWIISKSLKYADIHTISLDEEQENLNHAHNQMIHWEKDGWYDEWFSSFDKRLENDEGTE